MVVIPGQHVQSGTRRSFSRNLDLWLTEADSEGYQQVVVFGIRRTRQERERLKDIEVSRDKGKLWQLTASTRICHRRAVRRREPMRFRPEKRRSWCIGDCLWMRLKTSCRVPRHIGRRKESSLHRGAPWLVGH